MFGSWGNKELVHGGKRPEEEQFICEPCGERSYELMPELGVQEQDAG